jgi:hypothetical protein
VTGELVAADVAFLTRRENFIGRLRWASYRIDSKMDNFTVVVLNQLNFNKVLEARIAQLAAALPHPNGGDFPGQLVVPITENVKAVITRSGKSMAKPKAKSLLPCICNWQINRSGVQ